MSNERERSTSSSRGRGNSTSGKKRGQKNVRKRTQDGDVPVRTANTVEMESSQVSNTRRDGGGGENRVGNDSASEERHQGVVRSTIDRRRDSSSSKNGSRTTSQRGGSENSQSESRVQGREKRKRREQTGSEGMEGDDLSVGVQDGVVVNRGSSREQLHEQTVSVTVAAPNSTRIDDVNEAARQQYIQEGREAGWIQDPMKERLHLEMHVRKILFQKVKFITCDEELSDFSENSIAMTLIKSLEVPVSGGRDWWTKHKSWVYSALVQKRSNVNLDMKKTFVGEYRLWN
jgi:hypothetical protein